MSHEAKTTDLASLSNKIGKLIRINELKVAGKLLATARTHLHQLGQKDPHFLPRYEQVADLRNELMEPGGDFFDEKELMIKLLEETKHLSRYVTQQPSEPLLVADSMIKVAAAVLLVYAEDKARDAPLDF